MMRAALLAAVLVPLPGAAAAQDDYGGVTARPTARPTPRAPIRTQIDAHVDELVEKQENVPRFQTSVDVLGRSPQDVVDRYFRGFDVECGPPSGVPTHVEMREAARYAPPPTLDFLALGQALARALASGGQDRFFLYRVHQKEGVSYVLREGPMPTVALHVAGADYELVRAFPTREEGARAWRQLERGQAVTAMPDATPIPDWIKTNCRP